MEHTFFHISANADFASVFLNTGACSIGHGQGGQSDGFYVWTNRKAAYKHIIFKNRTTLFKPNSDFQDGTGLIVGITVPVATIKYPTWQLDLESVSGLEELWYKHHAFLNKAAHNLRIPLNADQSENGKFTYLTGLSCSFYAGEDCCPVIWVERQHYTGGYGIKKVRLGYFENTVHNSGISQIITDFFCQNNHAFVRDYNALMQSKLKTSAGAALKYTGRETLPISSLDRIKIIDHASFTYQSLYPHQGRTRKLSVFMNNQNQHQ